jgi:hypothetical protein
MQSYHNQKAINLKLGWSEIDQIQRYGNQKEMKAKDIMIRKHSKTKGDDEKVNKTKL